MDRRPYTLREGTHLRIVDERLFFRRFNQVALSTRPPKDEHWERYSEWEMLAPPYSRRWRNFFPIIDRGRTPAGLVLHFVVLVSRAVDLIRFSPAGRLTLRVVDPR